MRHNLAIAAVLVLVTVAVYWPVHANQFINIDDSEINDNPHVSGQFTAASLTWALASTDFANWIPLTRLSWIADWRLFHGWAGGHHLVDVGLHASSGVILFFVLASMTGRRWPSAFVAALFLLHPLHVESVAWAIERKDTLSGLFWMLTLAAYLHYVRRPGAARHVLLLVTFALGLMAKQMLVTLPLVLLLLDYWPLRRLGGSLQHAVIPSERSESRNLVVPAGKASKSAARAVDKKSSLTTPSSLRPSVPPSLPSISPARLILEKLPLLLLAAAAGAMTVYAQSTGGAVADWALPFGERLSNAMVAYVAYLGKAALPVNLSIFYPYVRHGPVALAIGAAALLVALTAGALVLRRKQPHLAVGWFWYLAALIPVIGLVQVGLQSMADRYTYIPLIGIFIAVAWTAVAVADRWRLPRWVPAGAGAGVLAACAALTWVQVSYWANGETVMLQALRATGNSNWFAHAALGDAYYEQGKPAEAKAELLKTLQVRPDWIKARNRLGIILAAEGNPDAALEQYRLALATQPDFAEAYVNAANAWAAKGRIDEAVRQLREAIRIAPNHASAHSNLGNFLADQGQLDEAVAEFREAIRINPDLAEAHNNLGSILAQQGHPDEAAPEFREAIRAKPDFTQAWANLGTALAASGHTDEAIQALTAALKLRPDWPQIQNSLARLLVFAPDPALRSPPEAVRLAARACQLTGHKVVACLDTLAAALAAAGRFPDAVTAAREAAALAASQGHPQEAAALEARARLYEAGRTAPGE